MNLIFAELQRHIIHQVKSPEEVNIIQDGAFKSLRNVCNLVFKRVHSKGIGTEAKVTFVIRICICVMEQKDS